VLLTGKAGYWRSAVAAFRGSLDSFVRPVQKILDLLSLLGQLSWIAGRHSATSQIESAATSSACSADATGM
jgi:hypothetical protein